MKAKDPMKPIKLELKKRLIKTSMLAPQRSDKRKMVPPKDRTIQWRKFPIKLEKKILKTVPKKARKTCLISKWTEEEKAKGTIYNRK
jgi:hypothetical protein